MPCRYHAIKHVDAAKYGLGDIDGRTRFAIEVLRSVRQQVGPDFPIICRLSGDEYVEDGLDVDDTRPGDR